MLRRKLPKHLLLPREILCRVKAFLTPARLVSVAWELFVSAEQQPLIHSVHPGEEIWKGAGRESAVHEYARMHEH
jgi:hypothetical protein